MANLSVCWSSIISLPAPPPLLNNNSSSCCVCIITSTRGRRLRRSEVTVSATKPGGFASIFNGCSTCKGQGAIECPGCKGTGRNKKNGNIFERWKCYDCQGFGLKSCPSCGKGGLTPEQRGER